MNLAAALGATARTEPGRPAVIGPGRWSHGDIDQLAGALAARLGTRVAPDDRVAIVAGNEPAFVVAYLAVLRLGAVAVPINPAAPSHECAMELGLVTPVLVLTSPEHADLAARACGRRTGDVAIEVVDIAALAPTTDAPAPVARAADDLAVLLFTAGTAGAPKPAMLTHGSLLANIEQMQSHPGLRLHPDDVVLGVLPFFHVYGCNVVLGLALHAGAAVSLVPHFQPAGTLAQCRTDGVTVVAGVPALFESWLALDQADAPPDALGSVRLCVSGATRLPATTVAAMRERFGVAVHDGYGLTEASPVVATNAVAAEPRAGSIGPPLPGVVVELLDRDGNPVLDGDPGEVVVRGPNVFAGYWNDPAATAEVLRDGRLHTGDIAVAGDDGWLTLVDRVKDLIIVSGFNVFPGEVEDALRSHDDVAEVAVVGEPHPRTGEQVVAYVVPTPGRTPDPVEIVRHAGRRLARYKLPTRVEVVSALPRTAVGSKVVRRALSGTGAPAPDRPDATTNPA